MKSPCFVAVENYLLSLDCTFNSNPELNTLTLPDQSLTIRIVDFREYANLETPTLPFRSVFQNSLTIVETIWEIQQDILKNRISTLLGKNIRIFGRSCSIQRLTKQVADAFLIRYHILGPVSAPFRYGLYYKGQLVAVSLFSKSRTLHSKNLRSAELTRFACKSGISVVGGLSKLIKNHVRERSINHVMTYIDPDWGDGKGFLKLGFQPNGYRKPDCFWFDPKAKRIMREKEIQEIPTGLNDLVSFKNRGSFRLTMTLTEYKK